MDFNHLFSDSDPEGIYKTLNSVSVYGYRVGAVLNALALVSHILGRVCRGLNSCRHFILISEMAQRFPVMATYTLSQSAGTTLLHSMAIPEFSVSKKMQFLLR